MNFSELTPKKLWRMYTSIHFGLFLLAVITAVSIFGTMYYAANKSFGDQGIPLAKARVFGAWWFFALLGFFFVQFVISTWSTTKMSVSIWWKKDFSRTSDQLSRSKSYTKVAVENAEGIRDALARRFTRAHQNGNKFYAQRGLGARIGPTIIHAGIIVILLSNLVRIILANQGYIISEGRFSGVEGATEVKIFQPKDLARQISNSNIQAYELDFHIKVHDFDEIKFANSEVPAYFSSLVEVIDPVTQKSRFHKLDMNNSMTINGLDFHQASYVQLPDDEGFRFEFDVRHADSGERLEIADASPGTRVQIGQTDYFLEVDGFLAGDAFRIYHRSDFESPLQTGTLKGNRSGVSLRAVEFFPDFDLRKEEGVDVPVPYSKSPVPRNPALIVEILQSDVVMGKTMILMDEELNAQVTHNNPFFKFSFADIEVVGGGKMSPQDFETFDWNDPSLYRFILTAEDLTTGETQNFPIKIKGESEFLESSVPVEAADTASAEPPLFHVYPIGKVPQFATVFSVVREPLVHYNTLGVALIFIGAIMTFVSRYLAFHGIYNPETRELEFALFPRFGAAKPEEIDAVKELILNNLPAQNKPIAKPLAT
ncbi:MAG: cytochrome c biogenesis protein ResB [Candidatus Sumerlaeia bacterium]|nr:cytochrome c biogenesis protein ResB [Candidatus Sumerlaeia bacterium]